MEVELAPFEEIWDRISQCRHREWESALTGIVQSLTPTPRDLDARRYVVQDLNVALQSLGLHVRPFGSSLSNLGFPDSDVDLLLAGTWRGLPLYELPERERKALLRKVGSTLYSRRAVAGNINYILHARVPLLKFVHAPTGVECDLTLQSYDGALKGRFMAAMAQLDTRFPALFRLVKLWARTHECNDASQSTLNSTSLMYMVIFFLQRLGVLPALRVLCPRDLAALGPDVRLLDQRLRGLWIEEANLDGLIAEVDALAADINRQKQAAMAGRGGSSDGGDAGIEGHARAAVAAVRFDLTQLLVGFLCYWELPMGAWAEGRHRDWRPDVWSGVWRRQRYSKAYLCPLEDPFDASDNPARAVGSESVSPGSQHLYIAAVLGTNAAALRRLLLDAPQHAQHDAAAAGVRVLRGLAWTLGLSGVRLLRPPLPAHQLASLAAAAGDPATGGSQLARLLAHLGTDVVEEDILDHFCWQAYRNAQRTQQRERERAAAAEAGVAPPPEPRRRQRNKGSGGGAQQQQEQGLEQQAASSHQQPQQQQQQPPLPPPPRRGPKQQQRAAPDRGPRGEVAGAPDLVPSLAGLTISSVDGSSRQHQQQRKPQAARPRAHAQHEHPLSPPQQQAGSIGGGRWQDEGPSPPIAFSGMAMVLDSNTISTNHLALGDVNGGGNSPLAARQRGRRQHRQRRGGPEPQSVQA